MEHGRRGYPLRGKNLDQIWNDQLKSLGEVDPDPDYSLSTDRSPGQNSSNE